MSLTDVLGWNGKGYQAIVMVGATEGREAKDVFRWLRIVDEYALAPTQDIVKARDLLNQVVRGLAYSSRRVRDFRRDTPSMPRKLWGSCIKEWNGIRSTFGIDRRVYMANSLPHEGNSIKVPLVTFARQVIEDRENSEHIAPDPLLLTVKAAVNWSRRANQKIMAVASVFDDDGWSERDQMCIIELFAAWRDALHRPKTLEQLAVGLGQPHGYQG